MIESDFVGYVKTRPTIEAMIEDRMDPLQLEQGETLPALTYQVIDIERTETHNGDGLATMRMQINCWGATYKDSKLLAREVKRSLHHFRGTMGTTQIEKIRVEDQKDDSSPDAKLWAQVLDALITYNEEV